MKKKIIRSMRKMMTTLSPVWASKIMYKVKMKKTLELKDPKTFNEKINWLKLNVFPNDQKIIDCTDKFKVRKYLKEKNMEKYLTKLYGAWDTVEELDWEKLPNSFALKCNHGCGYNIICADKQKLDKEETINKLNMWMKEDFSKVSGEPHYGKIQRKIICEEFLEDEILDYKFFCFNGEPKYFYISQNVKGDFHNMQADFFNADGSLADFIRSDHQRFEKIPEMPENLNEMLDICRELSKEIPFVRVDLFNVSGKIYFSELTFTPCSGFMPLEPQSADEKMGELLNLELYK